MGSTLVRMSVTGLGDSRLEREARRESKDQVNDVRRVGDRRGVPVPGLKVPWSLARPAFSRAGHGPARKVGTLRRISFARE